ncbi:MAG: SRPBCC domain-containing protein [Bacteroidota bacterium]
MSTPSTYETTITIHAPVAAVWDALVNPDMTQQYLFGCVPVTNWQVGSPLIWRGAADGVDYVTGSVVKFEPESALAYTTFNPHGNLADVPENYLVGEYRLTAENGATVLAITQGNFATAGDGQQRYEEAVGAWDMTLKALKALLEG